MNYTFWFSYLPLHCVSVYMFLGLDYVVVMNRNEYKNKIKSKKIFIIKEKKIFVCNYLNVDYLFGICF